MAFVRARTSFGGHHIEESSPRITIVHNAVVQGWAVYDDRRLLVPDSAFMREGIESGGPGLSAINAGLTMNLNPYAGRRLPDDDYVWIGHIHDHFGHFLVSTLSRLWAASRYSSAKFVTACPGDLDRRLKVPFIATIIEALGIDQSRFVEVSDYSVIPTLTVPEALFIENSSANRLMSDFCFDLADRIVSNANPDQSYIDESLSDQPLFLSKRNVQHGIRTIINESEFADRLEQQGVRIVSPETLTFAEQIQIWRSHSLISAFEGSSLHNAIFVKQKKILSISTNHSASSNQALINEAASHQALYLNSNGELADTTTIAGFQLASRLTDPKKAAQCYMSAMAYLARSDEHMRMRSMHDTVSPWLFIDEPFGINLSRHKPADMSSIDPNWSNEHANAMCEAAGAVSGILSGRYQFHTKPETAPWWQVDLQTSCLVTEIRVFNRNDVAQFRARSIVLWRSDDGIGWTRLHQRDEHEDFGGGQTPRPWRWWQDVPFKTRFVRVSLDIQEPEFFHLDQVEVFGFVLSPSMPMSFE